MLPTFVIGLREGLEAALIVGIIAAFLGQQGRRDALRQVWLGTGVAVLICIGIAIALQVISHDLPQRQQEGLETVVGALAVVMVTYMILFMRSRARGMKRELEGAAASALASGSSRALVIMAFLAVLREGFETAVFLLATFNASGDATTSWIGAVIGVALAAVIGYGIYKGGVRLNLARFFKVTGLVLVVVAAGLVMTAFMTANEAGWLNFGQAQAFDLSWLVRPGTPLSSLLTGVLGIQPFPSWIMVAGWLVYLVPMVAIVAWPARRRTPPRAVTPAPDLKPKWTESPLVRPDGNRRPRRGRASRRTAMIAVMTGAVVVAAGCSSSASKSKTTADSGPTTTVSVSLTPQGCAPKPAKVAAGDIRFNVTNQDASAVTEAELRTSNGSKILGEQENLTPGLSGGFELTLAPGSYELNCPGAAQEHWKFTVTGKSTGASWPSSPQLAAAVRGYTTYVNQQATELVSATQTFCRAIEAGNLSQARIRYPRARVYYEHIEPVAEIWGTLDTEIDGRWENPVTVQSQFTGFHRLEQLMWSGNTLTGAPALCSGLVKHEQQLLTLVKSAQYNPLELASGATDLVNEAATAKISGEEERYSNTDLPVFKANVDGAMEVVTLLTPYLQQKDPSLLTRIRQRDAAVLTALSRYQASPGYDDTGYVEYSAVLDTQRRQLSSAVNALAETLSQVSTQVGTA